MHAFFREFPFVLKYSSQKAAVGATWTSGSPFSIRRRLKQVSLFRALRTRRWREREEILPIRIVSLKAGERPTTAPKPDLETQEGPRGGLLALRPDVLLLRPVMWFCSGLDMMTHGWPGSIVEFQKVIEPLTNPTAHGGDTAEAFHVVCPSLPGYGFSDKPTRNGWNVQRIARGWAELMPRLGYKRYAAQGGDWGAIVTTCIGIQDPGNCIGIHLNMPIALPDPATMNDLTDKEKSAIAGMQHYNDWDSGYSKQQSTRPQTVSYGLTDSPAGQLTWILEKFWSWTDSDGHPENVLTLDELLDNVMLYWLPANAASSARLYWESFRAALALSDPVTVPVGCSIFPKEIFRTSRRWAEERFAKVVYFNELTKGGHFAAFEQPETFIREVRNCFRLMR